MRIIPLICASIGFIGTAASVANAQQPAEDLSNASTFAMLAESESISAFIRSNPVPRERPVKVPRWYKKTDNQVAIVLAAAAAVDAIGTYENMTHSRWLCGFDPSLVSTYRINGSTYPSRTGAGIGSIAMLCGPSSSGSNENYAVDVTTIDGSFTEVGWAARYVNNRDYTRVELLNAALDGAGLVVGRLIPKKGKMRWVKACVMAVNYAHAFGHLYYGVRGIQFVHSPNQKANNFFEARPKSAFYTVVFPGPRSWGKK